MITFFIHIKNGFRIIGVILFACVMLSGCGTPSLEQSVASALRASQTENSDAFLDYLDLASIRNNYLNRGYSANIIDSVTSPANASMIAMTLGGRDVEDQININYLRNVTENSGEFIIQCINNPRNSVKFVFAKIDGHWRITDYEGLGDLEEAYVPPTLPHELK